MTSIEDLFNVQMQNHDFSLPPNLPPSAIVYNDEMSMREKIVALCDKYIVTGGWYIFSLSLSADGHCERMKGEFELNLGSQHRTELLKKKSILEDYDDDECAAIFNTTYVE